MARRANDNSASERASEGSEGCEGCERISEVERRKLLARLRKLLTLACDAAAKDGEAQSALERARALLAKHGLNFADVYVERELEAEAEDDQWQDVQDPDPTLWPQPVDGEQLIKDLCDLLYEYLVMDREQEKACALWILHAHCHDAALHSPLLVITAPTIGCGKTQLLQCLEYLVPRPWATANATPAAIFNEIEHNHSTILIDEAETFMSERSPELRGILNSGHKRNGYVTRKSKRFSTWAPKAIALNGHLHATLESRAIIIMMQRKPKDITVPRLTDPKPNDSKNEFVVLRRKCGRWAKDNLDALSQANPKLPQELDDRAKDNWAPLLAIADQCGWSNRTRKAARAIAAQKLKEVPLNEELLKDLQRLFRRLGSPLSSKQIVAELVKDEARPWASYRGHPLTTTALAALLKPFRISPTLNRLASGHRAQGYHVAQFKDVFSLYVR